MDECCSVGRSVGSFCFVDKMENPSNPHKPCDEPFAETTPHCPLVEWLLGAQIMTRCAIISAGNAICAPVTVM